MESSNKIIDNEPLYLSRKIFPLFWLCLSSLTYCKLVDNDLGTSRLIYWKREAVLENPFESTLTLETDGWKTLS